MLRLDAPPPAVFDAWLDPELLKQWLFANDPLSRLQVQVDARPGGSFSILEQAKDGPIDHFGQYLEIDRPRHLRFTLQVPRHFPGETLVTVDIVPAFGGSELRFIQEGVSPTVTERPWREMI